MSKVIEKAYYPFSLLPNFELFCYEEFRGSVYLWILYKPMRKIFKFSLNFNGELLEN